jgi:hypothetical protein
MGACVMNDPLTWAAHYRQRAAECLKAAEASFDETVESHYRFLAERYLRLAECEEEFCARHRGLSGREL